MRLSRHFLPVTLLVLLFFADAGQSQTPSRDQYGDPLPAGAVARLGTLRWRHDDAISFAAFLPDGKSVVSLGGDQTIRVWEFPSGKEIRRISLAIQNNLGGPAGFGIFGAPRADLAVVLSKDGNVIATFIDAAFLKKGTGPKIRLHEVATGKELRALAADYFVAALAFSPNSEHLTSLDDQGMIHIWDWANGKELRKFANLNAGDNDSNTFAGRLFRAPAGGEGSFVHAPDGNTIMFLNHTNALRFIDVRTGKEIGPAGHATALQSAHFTADGKQVATQAADGSHWRWDAVSGKDLGPIKVAVDGTQKLKVGFASAISPDGQIMAKMSGGPMPVLTLADGLSGQEITRISLEVNPGYLPPSLGFAPGNKMLAVVTADFGLNIGIGADQQTRIDLYDVATGKHLQKLAVRINSPKAVKAFGLLNSTSLVFSPDGKTLAWSSDVKTISFWDTQNGKPKGSLTTPDGTNFQNAAFSPDGRCLALDMNDANVTMYELASAGPRRIFGQRAKESNGRLKPPLKAMKGPKGGFVLPTLLSLQSGSRVAISPDGKSLALAGQDRTVHVWDISTGTELAAFKGHTGNLNAVAFSPDSTRLASTSADTTALIWDLAKLDRSAATVKALTPTDLEQCWQALTANDGVKAFAAICELTDSPNQAVALIREKVQPAAPADKKHVEELIGQVDDAQFKVREKALSELTKLGEPVVPALEKALEGNPTLETKRRLEEMRRRLTSNVLQGDRLRAFRAVEVLERIGTPQARQVLQALADGAPGVLVTTSAQAALKR